jgi:phage tail tape-measure protein
MRTLIGLFETKSDGLAVRDSLRAEGLTNVQTIDRAEEAAETLEEAKDATSRGGGTGAVVGALAGGLLGSVPIAVVGTLIGRGLDERTAHEYERVVDNGGIALVVEAPEIQPAARAETLLRAGGAIHVHTGEQPRAS